MRIFRIINQIYSINKSINNVILVINGQIKTRKHTVIVIKFTDKWKNLPVTSRYAFVIEDPMPDKTEQM